MLNKKGERELAYVVKIDNLLPIEGYDRVEMAVVGGWRVIVRKGEFQPKDYAVYFEIDSKVPEKQPFLFLDSKKYKIKTVKMCKTISQGLIMGFSDFIVDDIKPDWLKKLEARVAGGEDISWTPLTKELGVTYATAADNERKKVTNLNQEIIKQHPKLFKNPLIKKLLKAEKGEKLLFKLLKKNKKEQKKCFPTHLPFITRTDVERCENTPWVVQYNNTPYIKTQKCDGTSATYILERKGKKKFEFYVCSRNLRQTKGEQNHYWEMAIKYDIENKLKQYLNENPELKYVCWQGEICGPAIQGNPHGLSQNHLFCFHMIDSKIGKYDIRIAKKIWEQFKMETVPIVDENYFLPSDFEELKAEADGFYEPQVCEGNTDRLREGFVYYCTTDPNLYFKNVSRKYLLKH